ncbi:hypothetical protein EKL37_01755, partial [Pseudomonas aeruginosa]
GHIAGGGLPGGGGGGGGGFRGGGFCPLGGGGGGAGGGGANVLIHQHLPSSCARTATGACHPGLVRRGPAAPHGLCTGCRMHRQAKESPCRAKSVSTPSK